MDQETLATTEPDTTSHVTSQSIASNTPAPPVSLVLVNVDILEPIFRSFFEDFENVWDFNPTTRKHLLSAALTCKSFFEPATNLLWRSMKSMIPSLKVLPEFVRIKEGDETYTIRGVISPHHINRFDIYRRKVRFLRLESFQELVRGHALALIGSMYATEDLFPGLKMIYIPSLTLYRTNLEYFNILFLAQSSSLLKISLGGLGSSSDEFTTSFLSVLSQRASSLHTLFLGGQLTSSSLDLVSKFSKLNALTISGQSTTLQTSFLEQCSTLKNLTHLIVDLDDYSTIFQSNPIIPHSSVIAFSALEYLQLEGSLIELSKLLQSIAAPSLKSIEITCSRLPYFPDVSEFSESIALFIKQCGRIAPSHRIRLIGTMTLGRTIEASLSPLQSCKFLRLLEISGITLQITDDMIRDICRDNGWRNLRILLLPPTVFNHSPSLSTLKILAQSCPDLHTLRISINFQNFQLYDDDPALQRGRHGSDPHIPHNLTNLSIYKASDTTTNTIITRNANESNALPMAISVSLFIEYYFPNLKESKLLSTSSGDLDWWKSVERMIGAYKMIRAETTSELRNLTSV